jgi:dTDP-4-amino-4,6-dideoxygalactose transaminase
MQIDIGIGRQLAPIRNELMEAFAELLDQGQFILGPTVSSFEQALSEFLGVPSVIGVGNGFDALRACLVGNGIQLGDSVAVSSHTCYATWAAIGAMGGKVIPIEPRNDTLNMNPEALKVALERMERMPIRAVIVAHMHGQAAEMSDILALCQSYGVPLIEDNAQAFGAQWKGQYTGTFGTTSALSFYPTKNLGALGDAGAVLTTDELVAERLRAWRNYGSIDRINHTMQGTNSRLDELQAAFLMVMLPYVNRWNAERKAIAQQYISQLGQINQIEFQSIAEGATHVYHHCIIRTPVRDALREYLAQNGIPTGVHYPFSPIQQPASQALVPAGYECPIADAISRTTLSLPCFPGLTSTEIDYICEKILFFYNK